MRSFLALLAIVPATLGHFLLNYPGTLGFDEDMEGTSPCGGFPITFGGNVTNVTVGSLAIALTSTHPQANWLFRATLNTQAPFNWTNLSPVISETGLGNFCLPTLSVPSSFAGQQGLIQVQQDAADGVLYQCAAVNFLQGSNSSVPSLCVNGSGITATRTSLNAFSNTTNATTTSTSSGSASATSKAAGVRDIAPMNLIGGLVAVLPVGFLLL